MMDVTEEDYRSRELIQRVDCEIAMASLLGLPSKIRNMIYTYRLVVEGEINPHPTYYEKDKVLESSQRKPDVALLQVNRLVESEAAPILYGKNLWRLSYSSEEQNSDPELSLWFTRRSFFRHVVANFDVRDIDQEHIMEITRLSWLSSHAADEERKNWISWLQDEREQQARNMSINQWYDIIEMGCLDSVTVDVSNCFCPQGCCRLVEVLNYHYLFSRIFDTNVTVIGCISEAEEQKVLEEITGGAEGDLGR